MEKEHICEARELILSAVQRLNKNEWQLIASLVDRVYNSKAGKVSLDSSELDTLRRYIDCDILGKPFKAHRQAK